MSKKQTVFPYGLITEQPAILLNPGTRMGINRITLHFLGNPRYIQFWWSKSEKALLIEGTKNNASFVFGITDHVYKIKGNMNIRNSSFLKLIMRTVNWCDENQMYAMLGEYIPALNMVAFRTGDAVKTEVETDG